MFKWELLRYFLGKVKSLTPMKEDFIHYTVCEYLDEISWQAGKYLLRYCETEPVDRLRLQTVGVATKQCFLLSHVLLPFMIKESFHVCKRTTKQNRS